MAVIVASPSAVFGDRTVTARYFGTGDASRLVWNLAGMDSDRALLMPVIYRKDWQMPGHYRLYSTARTNLALQSQTLDNASWAPANGGVGSLGVVTPNYGVAPDGTTTAERVVLNLNGGTVAADISGLNQAFTFTGSQAYTLSLWMKTTDSSTKKVILVIFNTQKSTGETVDGTWRRFTYTFTPGSTAASLFALRLRGNQVALGESSDSADLLVWGVQLETGSTATPYIPTTTGSASVADYAVDANGKVTFAAAPVANADVAYLDPWFGTAIYKSFGTGDGTATQFSLPWKSVTEQIYKSDWAGNQLMYSSSRTNIFLRSQEFDNGSWTKTGLLAFGAGSTANAAVAPDGTTTADLITEDSTGNPHRVYQSVTLTAAVYTASWYIKPNGRTWVYIYADAGNQTAYVNLSTGAVGTKVGTPTITYSALADGWYRVAMTWTNTTVVSQNVQLWSATGNNGNSYTGDGASGLYLWGAQVEIGSSPTGYIATAGTTASVTDYTITPGGTVTFATAPVSGAVLTWTGNYGGQR